MSELVKKQDSLSSRIATAIIKTGETYDILAKNLGVSRNTIMTYKKCQGDIKGIVIENLVKCYNFNPSWLLTGESPIYKDTKSDKQQEHSDEIPSSENITKVVIENQDMVKRFKNQERAKEINEDLIEIEEISDELLNSIASHIKSSLNAAKIVKEASKKTPQKGDSDLQERSSA